jgi:hypothetical protein
VYAAAYAHVARRLGTEWTTSTQLERVGRQMFGIQWGGVHARDTLPTVARTGRDLGDVRDTAGAQEWRAERDVGALGPAGGPFGRVSTTSHRGI